MKKETKVFLCGKTLNKLDPGYKGKEKVKKKETSEVKDGVHK